MDETLRAAVREYLRENLQVRIFVDGEQSYEGCSEYLNVTVTARLELEGEEISVETSNTGIYLR